MHALTTYYFDTKSSTFRTKTIQKSLGPNDLLIMTTHSGLCATDVHAKAKECGLGHEGVGFVRAVGQSVTQFTVNQRVGWGWLHSSCGYCSTCVTGYRQYCGEARGFAFSDLDQGAFSDNRIIDAAFAYPIPAGIDPTDAAPLMCAGASTFEALDVAGTKPDDRVGVFGVGGLGHMAILFAKSMGCAVTAITSKKDKIADAFRLGADEVRLHDALDTAYLNGDDGTSQHTMAVTQNINVLLITSNGVQNLEPFMPLLARRATIVLMTIQQEALQVPYMPFVLPGHRLIASTEASRENHIKMLEFAARHKIKPWIEQFDMTAEGLSHAFNHLESGNMRYRGVLVRRNLQ
ncbi:hypothetical protein BAUCODRAFT_67182 [Baudoinia panamericana UAMH 10762]|uniref:Enoyl reductase (ER) domain-containing protein n=1 Tax=Baudoinia panamericana (strain UAMH 10762) TaxID=717646 RepID=M2N287_BAUPA|nr:uncharacterized protein BAUCODRAFT_67182 [Baudoinia panamericana UAMH 10762]EMC98018.1 hypothetical protein BAUCODRAFT_67182 [Baudoinia panamericana UAMH 10762]